MSTDIFVGLVIAAVVGLSSWSFSSTLRLRERWVQVEEQMKGVLVRLARIETEQITLDCVRQAIKEVLDERDKVEEGRHAERERLHALELEKAIEKHLSNALPRIVQQIVDGLRQ